MVPKRQEQVCVTNIFLFLEGSVKQVLNFFMHSVTQKRIPANVIICCCVVIKLVTDPPFSP